MLLCLLCLIWCLINGFPGLPISKTGDMESVRSMDILVFLKENLFAIVYFFFSLVFGAGIGYFGVMLDRKDAQRRKLGRSSVMLSCFIILSGLWLLTDSRTLMLFTENTRGIVLISYMSFLLMPLPFVSYCMNQKTLKLFQILDGIFTLNLAVFLIFVILKADNRIFYISLAVQHTSICILMFTLCIMYLQSKFRKGEKSDFQMPLGGFLCFLLTMAALVLFLLGFENIYSIAFGSGLICLIFSIAWIIFHEALDSYKVQIQLEDYKQMAYTDALSSLGNRHAFYEKQQATADSPSLCYVILDINGLKYVNNHLGHQMGDKLISAAAEVIYRTFAPIGECYRIGGDEFAVICTDQEEPAVKKTLKDLEKKMVEQNDTQELKLSLAYGYSFRRTPEMSVEELFHEADSAMYAHKESRRTL